MSWDVDLYDDRNHREGEWNYTHNCNSMISDAYQRQTGTEIGQCSGPLGKVIGPAWWEKLDGATGADGRDYLAAILAGLRADPGRYRAMNPPNGWGDYDSLIDVLQRMHDAVPEWPTSWTASG